MASRQAPNASANFTIRYSSRRWESEFMSDTIKVRICLCCNGDWFECARSEEHTSELQSLAYLVCRLLLEKNRGDVPVTADARHAGVELHVDPRAHAEVARGNVDGAKLVLFLGGQGDIVTHPFPPPLA